MKCPKCKSDNIKKLSAILDQDTTTLNLGTNLAGVIGSIGGGGNLFSLFIFKIPSFLIADELNFFS